MYIASVEVANTGAISIAWRRSSAYPWRVRERLLVRERERRCHRERLVPPARGRVHLDLRRRRAHGCGERELPRHGRRELAPRRELEPPAPRVGHGEVDPPRAAAQSSYNGQTYYFCCAGCKKQFDAAPEKYLGA